MTIEKAIKIIDLLIEVDTITSKSMNRHIKEWTQPNEKSDLATRTAIMIRDLSQWNLKHHKTIKEELQPLENPKKPKCRHLKKYHDVDPEGNLYCTSCNQNL